MITAGFFLPFSQTLYDLCMFVYNHIYFIYMYFTYKYVYIQTSFFNEKSSLSIWKRLEIFMSRAATKEKKSFYT